MGRPCAIGWFADGIDGLYDQPKGHNPEKLSENEQAVLLAKVFQNPGPEQVGTCNWALIDLCDFVEVRFGKEGCWAR